MNDLIIIGGGPAGIAAGIYAVRYGLDTYLLERTAIGGQISSSQEVENYPGFSSINGMELMNTFKAHAESIGVPIENKGVTGVRPEDDKIVLSTDENVDIEAKAVIIATGAKPRKLGIPGEDTYYGRGVSYCATCDAPFYKERDVIVVGGGNTAISDALILSNVANKVYQVHRRDELRASKVLEDRARSRDNIEFLWDTVLEEVKGNNFVESALLRDLNTNELSEISIDGVFIYVGIDPNTDLIDVEKDESGFIITNEFMETSVEGIYAAGDCRKSPLWQVITAASDGAIAAAKAYEYIRNKG
ncbi:thioredoxin reductase [Methanohalobium evestigatum Z-7303]|uniref:Thioredoxin reductase n=1 Tax=Methanohalobium evestigatum (strain ATCC BAA-1072 / DSM 3721 / NBRC 107634 / OCM 161 / Z-7303) TaxID=644295 RepID=D7E6Y8_METEZ|nr:thioredoxin-disulfide reductase [Methanohalobium evestigatum]ADI73612.1 thioredoxin reductase [Methanohalobium evestigatum Z-7303]